MKIKSQKIQMYLSRHIRVNFLATSTKRFWSVKMEKKKNEIFLN